jgi:phosphoglycerol transferase
VLGAVLLVGLFDQVSAKVVPDYDRLATDWNNDAEYFDMIAEELGPDAKVFQYPHIPFPEAGIVGTSGPYDLAKGFIHAPELDWSWGGVEGRPEDWSEDIASVASMRTLVNGITAAGFDGLLIDRNALGYGPLGVEAKLTRILGEEPQISPDDSFSFYDLRAYRAELEATYTPEEIDALAEQALTGEGLP